MKTDFSKLFGFLGFRLGFLRNGKGRFIFAFLAEWYGRECSLWDVTERNRNLRSVRFAWRLPSVAFRKIELYLPTESNLRKIFEHLSDCQKGYMPQSNA
uniref:Uncharacterized protein n=1 Tax=Romanomermis culicivorax TaxID=13658 RepID=A0A915JA41_ROMCU